jgi:hypothetical protein
MTDVNRNLSARQFGLQGDLGSSGEPSAVGADNVSANKTVGEAARNG